MKKVNLKSLFEHLQSQMSLNLNTNRQNIFHSGEKGCSLENDWLQLYLPNRYSVDKATVIDHTGETSDQIDIYCHLR